MGQFTAKVHFKDQWFNASTDILIGTEYSTQTLYSDTKENLDEGVKDLIQSRVGYSVLEGIRHSTELLHLEGDVEPMEHTLSKEEMFDFILKNRVQLEPDGMIWQKTNGEKIRKKYTVHINEVNMMGMDLEEAIQYYYDNLRRK